MKRIIGTYRMRSAKLPQMSAAVMIAKVSWYAQKRASGMVGASWWDEKRSNPRSQRRSPLP